MRLLGVVGKGSCLFDTGGLEAGRTYKLAELAYSRLYYKPRSCRLAHPTPWILPTFSQTGHHPEVFLAVYRRLLRLLGGSSTVQTSTSHFPWFSGWILEFSRHYSRLAIHSIQVHFDRLPYMPGFQGLLTLRHLQLWHFFDTELFPHTVWDLRTFHCDADSTVPTLHVTATHGAFVFILCLTSSSSAVCSASPAERGC